MTVLLIIHSWLRWVVLLAGFVVIAGAAARRDDARAAGRGALAYMIALDTQFLVGLILYLMGGWSSILTHSAAAAMHNDVTRFWAVEHPFGMFAGLILAHAGRVAARRAPTPAAARRRLVVCVFLSLVAILLTVPWPGLPYARPLIRT